mmetsp:Transcript_30763/g.99524  ORF Transcript_30763/g.99524 Transcript_30763/m.99524 type:complete len:314 (-) Transcript_30763:118-1059(-)
MPGWRAAYAGFPRHEGVRPERVEDVLSHQGHVQHLEPLVGHRIGLVRRPLLRGVAGCLGSAVDCARLPGVAVAAAHVAGEAKPLGADGDPLAQNVEAELVRGQPQHHQVGIEPVHAVARVRVVAWLQPALPYEVHDLVLALAGDRRVGEDDAQALPRGAGPGPCRAVVAQAGAELGHEGAAGGDGVVVEGATARSVVAYVPALAGGINSVGARGIATAIADSLGGAAPPLQCGQEAAGALLIHLGSWGHSVNGDVEEPPRTRGGDDAIDKPEYLHHHGLSVGGRRPILRVCRVVHNPIEVQVQGVKFDVVGVG